MTAAFPAASARAASAQNVIVVLAVLLAGGAAAFTVSPIFLPTTVLVVWVVVRGAQKSRYAALGGRAARELVDLPGDVRRRIADVLARVPRGDARRLLLDVVVQARPILASRSTTFDAAAEAASRANVESLLDASCSTALDLSRLDAVGARARQGDPRLAAARQILVKRLSDASAALGAFYAAGIEHGTPASEQVAELAKEITEDARARGAAATELDHLLGAE